MVAICSIIRKDQNQMKLKKSLHLFRHLRLLQHKRNRLNRQSQAVVLMVETIILTVVVVAVVVVKE
jgi:hypothetical protein